MILRHKQNMFCSDLIVRMLVAAGASSILIIGTASASVIDTLNNLGPERAPAEFGTATGAAKKYYGIAPTNSLAAGYFLQDGRGIVVALASNSTWSPQKERSESLNTIPVADRDLADIPEMPVNRLLNPADSALIVKARAWETSDFASARDSDGSFRFSTVLPMLALSAVCVWLALYFIDCIHPFHGHSRNSFIGWLSKITARRKGRGE